MYVAVIILAILLIAIIANRFSNNKFFCKTMGWHKRPKQIGFDGASQNGVCPRCGKGVMQDSQGNWF